MNRFLMAAVALSLLPAIPILIEAGRRIGARRAAAADGEGTGAAAMTGVLVALLGLLVAFTFSGAAARFDERKKLVIDEANAIGTAWLRLDLLPEEAQPAIREQFRQYLDLRISAYERLPDLEAARGELSRADAMQRQIWTAAVAGARTVPSPAVMSLLLPALNEMIDLTTTRTVMTQIHPPPIVYILLYALLLVSALLIGYEQAGKPARPWLHTIVYASVMAIALFVILNLEYPRLGLIGLDAADQVLVDLRRTMN